MKINQTSIKFILYFIFILYMLILSFGSVENFPDKMTTKNKMPYLVDKPIGEDAYYMLAVARNFARGDGLTYNFDIQTTGIQPLATIIYSIIYKFSSLLNFSDWTSLRLILMFNSILLIIMSGLLLNTANKLCGDLNNLSWIIPLFTLFNFGLFRTFTYGLETGLYLVLFCWTVNYSLKLDYKVIHFKQVIMLSSLVSITTLARIDFSVIIFIFFLTQYFSKKINLKNLIFVGSISAIIVLPWFFYIYAVTGSIIPSSGAAQSELSSMSNLGSRFLAMLVALNENFTPWLYTGARNIFVLIALLSLIIFIIYFRTTIAFVFNFIKCTKEKSIFYSWLFSILILLLIYIIFFWAVHFYYRYSSPISICIIIFFGLVIAKYFENKKIINKILFSFSIVALFFIQTYFSLHTGVNGNSHSVSAGFVKQNFSEARKIGAFQSGVIGYFNSNVMNLDGKIDNNALIAIKNKNLNKYIDDQGINVLIDWPGYIHTYLDSTYLDKLWIEIDKKIGNDASICLIRK